ncbi:uncharacterized protein ALTATR162_LOCUS7741 [Alternaria atra]|uniref:Borealin N-terminal domain-containing protein n=1 Tax=Alternaria atra TaxID=119953 RepID=A0A8J2I945_9PLEO|nr:uncharacterized protein ALTATR162_LOCUS7741 [Alternaria atra]CAG5174164.1 unnamed protein product [Alternaria atra]
MNNIQDGLTAEAKANMLANLQIEIDSRKEKLRAQYDAQCASMQSRLERRVNRIPTVTRQTTLLDLLKASAPAQPVAVPAPTAKVVAPKKTSAPAPAPAPAARKTRNAVPTNPSSSAAATSSPDNRRIKPVPKSTKPTPAYAKATKGTRAKKRSSDEMSGTDKENAQLPVPKKRTRTVAQKPPPAAAPATRATRAASRTKTSTSQVLSPKTNSANVKKPAARSARPR